MKEEEEEELLNRVGKIVACGSVQVWTRGTNRHLYTKKGKTATVKKRQKFKKEGLTKICLGRDNASCPCVCPLHAPRMTTLAL